MQSSGSSRSVDAIPQHRSFKLGDGKGLHDCNGDILPRQTMEKYDLIVVGSGPGGQRAAIQASKFGKRAALIEKLEVIGGTAINTGTIPSKTIREAVLHLSGYQSQSIYGVN